MSYVQNRYYRNGTNDMEDSDTQNDMLARTPPYISFSSFQTMIGDFHENGKPPRVDRSVLTRFAGGLGSQLIMALKSLGLTDEKNVPTELGRELIDAYGTDKYPDVLKRSIERSYPFLNQIDLQTATPSMFAEAFKKGTSAKEDVLRKCRTFYLYAAQAANIPVGPRLQVGKAGRPSSGTMKRRPRLAKSKAQSEEGNPGTTPAPPPPATPADSVANKLLDKFPQFDPSWGPDIQAKWFEGYSRLLALGDKT